MPYQTTLQHIATAALDLHRQGRLGYQSAVNRRNEMCLYQYEDGSRCAIGAGLPRDVYDVLNEEDISTVVGELIKHQRLRITDDYYVEEIPEFVRVLHKDDAGEMFLNYRMSSRLQTLHDACVDADINAAELALNEGVLLFALTELAAGRQPMNQDLDNKKCELSTVGAKPEPAARTEKAYQPELEMA